MCCRFVPIWPPGSGLLLTAFLFPWMLGCAAEEGASRHHVAGTVTFQGDPVPVGVIQFMPDSKQGNSGPPGFAEIKDGQFDTKASGKGTVGGPHLVTIEAYSGDNIDPDVRPVGDILVTGFQKRFTIKEDAETKLDIELTAK